MNARLLVVLALAAAVGGGAFVLFGRGDGDGPSPVAPTEELRPAILAVVDRIQAAERARSAERTAILGEVRTRLTALAGARPDEPIVPFWRGYAEVLAGEEAAATAAFGALVATARGGPRNPHALLLRSLHILRFDPASATEAVRRLRTLHAEAPEVLAATVARARYAAQLRVRENEKARGDHTRAIEAAREALRIAQSAAPLPEAETVPMRDQAHRALAYSLGDAGDWLESEKLWKELVDASKGRDVEAVWGLAGCASGQHRWAEAEAGYTAVLTFFDREKAPAQFRVALRSRTNCRRLLERYDDAKADLEAWLAFSPEDAIAMYWLGVVWNDGFQDPEKALALFERAHKVMPACENFLRGILGIVETSRPDPARAEAVRAEIDRIRREQLEARARAGSKDTDASPLTCEG